ncbi:M20/M25/M40 family metallo-hydrolase, partial [Staphylococcus caprae]
LEASFGVKCDFEFNKDYPALYNNPEFTSYVAETIKNAEGTDIQGVEECEAQPPSEDFAFYAVELPSTFIYSGAAPEDGEVYPHHHPKFNISESSMLVAAEAVGTV